MLFSWMYFICPRQYMFKPTCLRVGALYDDCIYAAVRASLTHWSENWWKRERERETWRFLASHSPPPPIPLAKNNCNTNKRVIVLPVVVQQCVECIEWSWKAAAQLCYSFFHIVTPGIYEYVWFNCTQAWCVCSTPYMNTCILPSQNYHRSGAYVNCVCVFARWKSGSFPIVARASQKVCRFAIEVTFHFMIFAYHQHFCACRVWMVVWVGWTILNGTH